MLEFTLSVLILLSHISIALFLLYLMFRKFKKIKIIEGIINLVRKNSLWVCFILSSLAVVATLYFSEVLLYTPCSLCWWQRVLLYPQALIFLVALIRNKKDWLMYTLPFAVIGFFVAVYQNIITYIPTSSTICAAGEVSCTFNYFTYFGYINIQIMSLTLFVLLIIFGLMSRVRGN